MPWGILCQDMDAEQHEEQLGCFEGVGKGERVSVTL